MNTRYFEDKYLIHVIGIGYVGLPLALLFSSKYSVIAFDESQGRIEQLKKQYDKNNEFNSDELNKKDIIFLNKIVKPSVPSIFIVTVPTPIDDEKEPDLTNLVQATSTVGSIISKGDIVIFESTVYPGCTTEICVPILEAKSNLTLNDDFSVGYSPERINPGDKLRTVEMIDKLVSSSSAESLQVIHKLYSSVMLAPVHKISKIEIAEAAKVIENIQRDVNIALMNEFSHIFNKLGLSTNEILEAASTKWNFLDFKPGLVGGHCIGVDPYYLVHKAKEVDYFPELILTARRINESMVQLVTNEIVDKTRIFEKENKKIKILILGYTFKENVSDTRNSKIVEIVDMLLKNDFQVNIYDPNIVQEDFVVNIKTEHRELFLYEIQKEQYHCLVVGVNHNLFQGIYRQIEKNSLLPDGIIFDLPNVGKFTEVSFAL